MKWHADSRRVRFGSRAGAGGFTAGLSGRWRWLCPGAEVGGAGVPGQEAVQVRADEGFPAVAAEGVWSNMKNGLGNLAACTVDQLAGTVRNRLRPIQHRPGLISGFLAQAGLTLEPEPP